MSETETAAPATPAAPPPIRAEYELVEASTLTTHPENPRRGDLTAIRDSLLANGFFGTLVVQKSTRRILAGNHRFRAGVDLGMKQFAVAWVDVDDAAARRILLADNRTGDLGGYDNAALARLLEDVAAEPLGLDGTAWSKDDMDKLVAKMAPPTEFRVVDDRNIPVQHVCPKCQYSWSGKPA